MPGIQIGIDKTKENFGRDSFITPEMGYKT